MNNKAGAWLQGALPQQSQTVVMARCLLNPPPLPQSSRSSVRKGPGDHSKYTNIQ